MKSYTVSCSLKSANNLDFKIEGSTQLDGSTDWITCTSLVNPDGIDVLWLYPLSVYERIAGWGKEELRKLWVMLRR